MFQLKLTPHVTFIAFDLSSSNKMFLVCLRVRIVCIGPDPYVVNSEYETMSFIIYNWFEWNFSTVCRLSLNATKNDGHLL